MEHPVPPDWQEAARFLCEQGIRFYPRSIRPCGETTIAFAKYEEQGFVVCQQELPLATTGVILRLGDLYLYPLDWQNYLALREVLPLAPSPCTERASFGTGDRLGKVSAAHLTALSQYKVFPVIAQQSPRELGRTGRDFREVLLGAVAGILETGYNGSFGADADHIKNESQLLQAAEAGYSLYTVDLSDYLCDTTRLSQPELADKVRALTPLSQTIIRKNSGRSIRAGAEARYILNAERLALSAVAFEEALQQAVRFYELLKQHHPAAFDFEVSIDESARVTTPEDHLYVVEYLKRSGVHLWSLAPRFPGEFHKGVDYRGDLRELEWAFRVHAALCRELGDYRLSLHSGSDKFSVYPLWREATEGNFHVKTSGTSWLQAIELVARTDPDLFAELYQICLSHLEESKRGYSISFSADQLPSAPGDDVTMFLNMPAVRQLFHISYGILLEERREAIHALLNANEQEHYHLVTHHIKRHLEALVG